MINNVNMCDIELQCFSTISIEKQFFVKQDGL